MIRSAHRLQAGRDEALARHKNAADQLQRSTTS